jgi:uncharacterized membrane protein YkoI
MPEKHRRALLAATAVATVALAGTAIAKGTGGSERDGDEHVTDHAIVEQVSATALRAAGGGTVTEVEVADEGERGYEVGVRRRDGSFVEVHLDAGFGTVSVERDDDGG